MPALGLHWTVLLMVGGYLLLMPRPRGTMRFWLLAPAAIVLLHMLLPWSLVNLTPGRRLVAHREGLMATVTVSGDADEHRALHVNNRFQLGGTAAATPEMLQAHLPLLLHADPRRALFLGVGTGITMEGATRHPRLHIEGVELLPEVVDFMPWFQPYNEQVLRGSNSVIRVADARRFIRSTTGSYDVIVADLFHPARDGAGFLYTREHFQAVRRRLEDGGVFCQWIPMTQVDRQVLNIVVRTFMEVFPDAHAWMLRFNVDAPVIGLVSRLPTSGQGDQWVEDRMTHPPLRDACEAMSLADTVRFLGHHLAGPEALRRLTQGAPTATDDWPLVSFLAPSFVYRTGVESHQRLMAWIQEIRAMDKEVDHELEPLGLSDSMRVRLKSYWRARDIYLEGLVYDAQDRREAAIEFYLSSARFSQDFTLGYARCLSLASLLVESDPAKSRRLLNRLQKVQPDNPVADQLHQRLFQNGSQD